MDAARIRLALEKLNVVGSALYVAAHPDDENTAMLAWLASGRKGRAAYLSLTRGDGGQNLIGSDTGELLGIIRTHELLDARRIDGAEQFFTRAVDFGYSKGPDETLAKWGREAVLGDVVRVIRTFQPDVIVMRFPTTGEGRHGHHTASALLAVEALAAAGDPARFPEQLEMFVPWQAKRLFWNYFSWKNNLNHWGYYSILSLAAVSEGKGIPSLITIVKERPEMAMDTKAVQSTDIYADKSLFALQILAQVALKDLDAHATLVEQAGLNRIPDSLWPKIGLALAGQYQFQNEKPDDNEVLKMVSTSSNQVRARPHVIGKNGQVIYIENRYGLKKLPSDEIEVRLALVDELLSVSRSTAADSALNHARSILMANKAKWG